jgi:hypothetical protein
MYTLSSNTFTLGRSDSGTVKTTGVLEKLLLALSLLVYNILEFLPLVSQSVHTTYTLLPKAAIAGFFEVVP